MQRRSKLKISECIFFFPPAEIITYVVVARSAEINEAAVNKSSEKTGEFKNLSFQHLYALRLALLF
jgi:hypothetical protein